ncbi:MAG: ABC transporter ATP-binding protein [Lachnospiraceae bacterium]|nr:ABC transporter ATP-binding protein [Lachnospiraceae bacterium]MDY4165543.1 ABC transporter ATP-binding protein [Lachnospiraceae bacterium]
MSSVKNGKAPEEYIKDFEENKGHPLKTFMALFKGYYHNLILAGIFFFIKHSPVLVFPIVTANIINLIIENKPGSLHSIIINAIVITALLILNLPMADLQMHFRSIAQRSVEAGLRKSLVYKIQQLSIPYQKDIETGRMQSKMIRDVEAVETLSDQVFSNMMSIITVSVAAFAVTAVKSLTVLVFFLLMGPVGAVVVYSFRKQIFRRNRTFRKEMESASGKVAEMVELVPVTRAHALEDEESRVMGEQIEKIAESGYQLDMVQTNFGAVSWICFQLFQVICLIFTARMALKGLIPAGDVVMYQSFFTQIVGQMNQLLNLIPILTKGLESVTSIGEILTADDIEEDNGKRILTSMNGDYDFKDVTYRYPDNTDPAVLNLNLHVNAGETVAFVGESGAGKSTILNLLVGFGQPSAGEIFIDGQPLSEVSLRSYRKFLAVVPQNTILFSGSVRENILYGTTGVTEEKFEDVLKKSGLESVIKNLPNGADTMVGEHGDKLSGGQKQRISIARALIRDPKVLILDEATSALDAVSEKEVSETLDSLGNSCTTFIVAHRLSTVRRADRIIVMKDGMVIESGTFDELRKRNGAFQEMIMAGAGD